MQFKKIFLVLLFLIPSSVFAITANPWYIGTSPVSVTPGTVNGIVPTVNGDLFNAASTTASTTLKNTEVNHLKVNTLTGFLKAASGYVTNALINLTSDITGTLPIANGGTGQTTATNAFTALAPSQGGNSGKFLTTNGTDSTWVDAPVTSPAGNTNNVQFKNGTSFDGSDDFVFDHSSHYIGIGTAAPDSLGHFVFSKSIPVNNGNPNSAQELNDGTFSYNAGDYAEWTLYSYFERDGVRYYSPTGASMSNITFSGDGDYAYLTWEAAPTPVSGYKICRSYTNSLTFVTVNDQYDFGNGTSYSDHNIDFTTSGCDVSPSGPIALSNSFRVGYDDGTKDWAYYTGQKGYTYDATAGHTLAIGPGKCSGGITYETNSGFGARILAGDTGGYGTCASTQFTIGNGSAGGSLSPGANPAMTVYDYFSGGTFQVGGSLSYGQYNGGTIREDSAGVGIWDASGASLKMTGGISYFHAPIFLDNAIQLNGDPGTTGQVLTSAGSGSVPTWNDFTSSQWSTSGSNIFYNTGNVGVGTSTPYANISIQSGTGTGDAFAIATTSGKAIFGVDNSGHAWSSGPAPVISSCGTGTGTVVGDDQAGVITTATAATACTATFSKAYQSAPVCLVTDNSLVGFADISSVSTSAVTFGISSALTGGKLYYSCSYHR